MTRQELFDRVVQHCNRQGERSVVDASVPTFLRYCVYRNERSLKCGIGALMPDEVYEEVFEGKSVKDLPSEALKACGFDLSRPYEMSFASDLQILHDDRTNWSGGRLLGRKVELMAKGWGLKVQN